MTAEIRRDALAAGLAAAAVLAAGMGFGRFAFTALYPHMVAEGSISVQGGSWAASANYAGYLAGALLAVKIPAAQAHRTALLALLSTALCLAALYFPLNLWLLAAVRGLAGVFSALALVGASLWLLAQRGFFSAAPLLYSGVGLGIAFSSEWVAGGISLGFSAAQLWLSLGLAALLLTALLRPALSVQPDRTPAAPPHAPLSAPLAAAWPLVCLYGLAGFGYIITATYLPLLATLALPDWNTAHVWAVFGLGAAPSCFLWHALHRRLGTRAALTANLGIQALGVMLPVWLPDAAGYLLSALLVGATFMGTVTIVMPVAQQAAKQSGTNLVAVLTAAYGIGQIAGPAAADLLYARTHNFNGALSLAAAALLLAALIAAVSFPRRR
ncbi:YbfB/YjiJ family MFS transporter [Bergeriella denitrificans]|uniref:Protein of uncharacterized function (DUF1228) n=1 Tax=Bergeriella denitrificans TaxID=494 RepID=A0A378UE23_BERDE|nr:YbfB/YjiJ family MFS transporter [Bergeriella denitrificans]STZ75664.1 Protein of uncharacterised function (DUF1228) [Bergeriella denitrificans]